MYAFRFLCFGLGLSEFFRSFPKDHFKPREKPSPKIDRRLIFQSVSAFAFSFDLFTKPANHSPVKIIALSRLSHAYAMGYRALGTGDS